VPNNDFDWCVSLISMPLFVSLMKLESVCSKLHALSEKDVLLWEKCRKAHCTFYRSDRSECQAVTALFYSYDILLWLEGEGVALATALVRLLAVPVQFSFLVPKV